MKKIQPIIQNGTGALVLNESILFDYQYPFYIDIPTATNTPFRIQFKINIAPGTKIPESAVTKLNENILEFTATFYDIAGSFVALKHHVPFKIAGVTYNILFSISRLIEATFRAEISLYEV